MTTVTLSNNPDEEYNLSDLEQDFDMSNLRERRLAELRRAQEVKAAMSEAAHGRYVEIKEEEFLTTVTKSKRAVVHFYHEDFHRCKYMDAKLEMVARRHFGTRFVKLHAPDAGFFVNKLNVKVLPSVLCFGNSGVLLDRIVGFEDLGGHDDFTLASLEARLVKAGVIDAIEKKTEYKDSHKGIFASKVTHYDSESDSD